MEKVTWSKRMIAAAVMSIATPIVTVFMTGYYAEEGGDRNPDGCSVIPVDQWLDCPVVCVK